MSIKKNSIFLWGIFLLGVLFFCPFVSRAEVAKVTVDKGIIDLGVQPKQDTEFSFSVRNNSSRDQKINLSERDIAFGDDNAMEFVDVQGGPSELVVFKENDFVLKPGEARTVSGVIKLSQEGIESAYYKLLTVVSFSDAGRADSSGGLQINGGIGVYTFVRIGDGHDASGKINSIDLAKFIKKGQEVSISYENTGDVYFVPEGNVRAMNLLGGFQKKYALDKHFVFPGKKVIFSGKMDDISSWGFFQVRTKFIDGNGGLQVVDRYVCGYLFPLGVCLFLLGSAFLVFIIRRLRKINQTVKA